MCGDALPTLISFRLMIRLRKKVSVQEYFRLRYGKDLDPNGYVVVRKKKTNSGYVDEYYPMELLSIAPNQRRKGMTAKERDELPRVTSLLPTESFRMNEKVRLLCGLGNP